MTMKGRGRKPVGNEAFGTESVEAFLSSLKHPHKEEIVELRRIILSADPTITEGIKWKVPSFRTSEYFATMNLRAKSGVAVILHFGAKKRDDLPKDGAIADPERLLEWLALDRAMVTFRDAADVARRAQAFSELLRQWIRYV